MTAAEAMAMFEKDEAFLERHRKLEERRQQIDAIYQRAEEPLVAALDDAGIQVESAWDLVNRSEPYPDAIPVLLDHLQRDYPDRVKEGIARALAVPDARDGWPILLQQFEAIDDSTAQGPKWGISCALEVIADDDVIDDVIRLVRDGRHGENRSLLLDVLARSEHPEALELLREMRADPDIGHDADRLLQKRSRRSRRPRR